MKLTCYQPAIRGDRMTVYFGDFPINQILRPPEGWAFQRITQWRKGCPDECWRIVYGRLALGATSNGK